MGGIVSEEHQNILINVALKIRYMEFQLLAFHTIGLDFKFLTMELHTVEYIVLIKLPRIVESILGDCYQHLWLLGKNILQALKFHLLKNLPMQ